MLDHQLTLDEVGSLYSFDNASSVARVSGLSRRMKRVALLSSPEASSVRKKQYFYHGYMREVC